MTGLAVLISLSSVAAVAVAALGIRRLPTLYLQVAALAVICTLLPLAAMVATGLLMFRSSTDVALLAVGAGSATAALAGALLVAHGIGRRMERLRAAPEALASGDLSARAERGGPAEVDALAAALNEMADRLEELLDARRRLVMWAGHDLRTPLASLQAMTEAIEDGLAAPEDYMPTIRSRVADMGRMVDDLFELARLDAGTHVLELRPAPVPVMVDAAVRAHAADADARGVRLEGRVADGLPDVRCAPDKVQRILDNLLGNALRHTPANGSVSVLAQADGDAVRLEVRDTGEGVADGTLERMFDHFWRGDRARAADGGAGLGLAIARGLVEAQGGRIWAEHGQGCGTRLCFTLPVDGHAGVRLGVSPP